MTRLDHTALTEAALRGMLWGLSFTAALWTMIAISGLVLLAVLLIERGRR